MRRFILITGLLILSQLGWSQPNLTHLEYWFDTEIEQRTTLPIDVGVTYNGNHSFDTEALELGLHTINYRIKNENGVWSNISTSFFHKVPNISQEPNGISAYQFWIDNNVEDRVTISSSESSMSHAIDVNNLVDGIHLLTYRVKDVHGWWSAPKSSFFFKSSGEFVSDAFIDRYEYWFNNAIGNKEKVELAEPVNLYSLTTQVQTPILPVGDHTFSIRFRNTAGQWTVTSTSVFAVTSCRLEKPSTPEGNIVSCQAEQENQYITNSVENAETYNWQITPTEAATLEPDGTTVSVVWNEAFIGEAKLSVAPVNSCGEGESSDTLYIQKVLTPEKPTITLVEYSLNASSAYAWQWYRDLAPVAGLIAIEGADQQQYTPTESGSYVVEAYSEAGCSEFSDAYEMIVTEISNVVSLECKVYPNPSNGTFILETNKAQQGAILKAYTTSGDILFESLMVQNKTRISLPDYKGIVILQLVTLEAVNTQRLIIK
jgi:hypothetical protein